VKSSVRLGGLILAGLLLAGCAAAPDPTLYRADVGPRQERTVFNALNRVKASDAQRIAVLNEYDATNGKLRELVKQSRQVVQQWHDLDRTAPDFQAQVDTLAAKWATLNADEMKTRAVFDHNVAVTLGPKQWSQWQDFMLGDGYEANDVNDWNYSKRHGGQ
jgi:outer membrane murein-binding lipoprotein Lpp